MGTPNLVFKNQFGEETNAAIIGGSSQLSCNFIVDHTNGNGFGVRSVKGLGKSVNKVFMNTTATPATGSPNPLAGIILIQLESPFSAYNYGTFGFVGTVSGTPINISAGLTKGQAYIITSLGTTTQSQWQAIGLPANVTAAVGVGFVASTASAGSGTGVVETSLASGAYSIEPVGDPNLSCAPTDGSGAWIVLRILGPTSTSNPTPIPVAPPDGTVIGLTFNYSQAPSAELI